MYGNPLWKAGFDSMRKNKKNVIHKADDFSDEELERRSGMYLLLARTISYLYRQFIIMSNLFAPLYSTIANVL